MLLQIYNINNISYLHHSQTRFMKDKKITVRFYLNKKVQPDIIDATDGKRRKAYPLYLYITYNRKNMQFKSNYGMMYADIKDLEKTEPGLMAFEEKLVSKIIRFESGQLADGEEYDMRGLKERYQVYSHSLQRAIEKYLKEKLRLDILKTNNELINTLDLARDGSKNNVLLLFKAACLLFPGFESRVNRQLKREIAIYKELQSLIRSKKYDFPTIIDWLDGSYKNDLDNRSLGKDAHQLIDAAVLKFVSRATRESKE